MVHKECLQGVVTIIGGQTEAFNDTPGIGINNEDGLVGGIQYYGVGRFLSDTVDGEKLLAKVVNTGIEQLVEVVVVDEVVVVGATVVVVGGTVVVVGGGPSTSSGAVAHRTVSQAEFHNTASTV